MKKRVDKIVAFIYAPFKITKVLELLFAFNWLFLTILSLLPKSYIVGPIATRANSIPQLYAFIICLSITVLSFFGIWSNNIAVRRTMLLISLTMILFITGTGVMRFPISTQAGFIAILALLTMFSFWRIDKTR